MKVIINTVNFYNNVIIHVHDGNIVNSDKKPKVKTNVDDLSTTPYILINDNSEHPLIAQLEERILQVETEKQELIDQLNNNNK